MTFDTAITHKQRAPPGMERCIKRCMNIWVQRLLFLSLAPLLVVQGKYVRAVTPRLPEPSGPRAGREGNGPVLRLLIAGDSAAAGVGVDHQEAALSGRLVGALGMHFDLRWHLIAQAGYTTRDLIKRLEHEPAMSFDVIVVSLGVNDITATIRTDAWLAQQRHLTTLLRQRYGSRHVLLSSVPPMHEFRALPQPLRWLLGARARRFNAALTAAVREWPGCELLPIAMPSQPEALASDGFHPGSLAYRHWASQLADRVRRLFDSGTGQIAPEYRPPTSLWQR